MGDEYCYWFRDKHLVVRVCVFVCIYIFYVPVCMFNVSCSIGVFSIFWDKVSLMFNLIFTNSARPTNQQVPGILLLLSPYNRNCECGSLSLLLCGCEGLAYACVPSILSAALHRSLLDTCFNYRLPLLLFPVSEDLLWVGLALVSDTN